MSNSCLMEQIDLLEEIAEKESYETCLSEEVGSALVDLEGQSISVASSTSSDTVYEQPVLNGKAPSGTIWMSDVTETKTEWPWNGYVPIGKLTIIDGDPGVGKSSLTCDMAARVSTGRAMPDGSPGISGNVLMLSYEDTPHDTVVPRLKAHNAELSRIAGFKNTVDDPIPRIPDDIERLRSEVIAKNARLVVLDPLANAFGKGINANSDADVRRALGPLAALAGETNAAFVVVRHFKKSEEGPALYRGGGSIGIVAQARSVLAVVEDPDCDSGCVLAQIKSNLGPLQPSWSFRIDGPDGCTARVIWDGVSAYDAETLLCAASRPKKEGKALKVKKLIVELLQNGPMPYRDVVQAVEEAGIVASDRTARRVKQELGIVSKPIGFGTDSFNLWSLPSVENGQLGDEPCQLAGPASKGGVS